MFNRCEISGWMSGSFKIVMLVVVAGLCYYYLSGGCWLGEEKLIISSLSLAGDWFNLC